MNHKGHEGHNGFSGSFVLVVVDVFFAEVPFGLNARALPPRFACTNRRQKETSWLI